MRLARLLPFGLRVELVRLKRWPSWLLERRSVARQRLPVGEQGRFSHQLAAHASPLERDAGAVPVRLQRGKERNVTLAAGRIDGLVVAPYQFFSYHHRVGRPSRLRGFRSGLELRDGRPAKGVGGGCCQISNLLYYLALCGGMKVTERHRHALDLFPDHGRTVPFGCGATVFYNQADLRFENPLPQAVLVRLWIEERTLRGELWTERDPGFTVEVYEVGHRFFAEGGDRFRENRVRRRFRGPDGAELLDQEIAHNRGRVLYELPEEG